MKKILTTLLLVIVSLTIASCDTKKETKTEPEVKKVATQEKIGTTKNNKTVENKKEDNLKKIDELITKKLKDAKIEATVKTTDEKGTKVTVLHVTNDMDLSNKSNPGDAYTLNVLANTYIILGNIVASEVNGILPESIVITTKSKNIEGYIRTIIITEDVAKITGSDVMSRVKSILSLSMTDSDNDKIKDSIKFIKEYK